MAIQAMQIILPAARTAAPSAGLDPANGPVGAINTL